MGSPDETWPRLSPMKTGVRGHCPRCGKGHLFADRFIKLAPRCDVCHESLDGGWAAAAAAADSRMPRMLPCGHSWCTSCIQKGLDANGGLVDNCI